MKKQTLRGGAVACSVAAALAAAVPAAQAGPEEAMTKAGCMACHSKDKKVVGPAFNDVATKYKGQDVAATLIQKVRTGGKGVYGPVPMPPAGPDKIGDADLKAAIDFILAG
jgi:cytochrome c